MTLFSQGDIILVPFPFSDLGGLKRRPALILAIVGQDTLCMMLTSSTTHPGDLPIDWQAAGLPKPTVARVHRLFTIKTSLIIKTLGQLTYEDLTTVREA